jgi:phage gp37-like protein
VIFAELEDAIIRRITEHAGSGEGKLGYALNVGSYGGEFDSEAELEAARVKFPCALVLMKEIGRGTATSTGQKVPVTYTVFVAAQNRRGERARRRGAAGAIGTYQIAWDIRQLLKGQMLGFDAEIDRLVPGSISSIINGVFSSKSVSVYACSFSTTWYEDLTAVSDECLGEFLELDAAWDIPPLGNVQPPLPAAEADARDLIKPRETTP